MCIALPMKLVELDGHDGVAESEGLRIRVKTMLLPEARVGDFVIVHAGHAIQLLDIEEAERAIALFRELAAADDETKDAG